MSASLKSRLVDIFCRVMEVPSALITEETNPENLEEWDSLTHVSLIVALEQEFEIDIDPEEGIDLENFQMVLEFVQRKIGKRN